MSSFSINLSIASRKMPKHNAIRNIELDNAPRTSALAQPNVFLDDFFLENYNFILKIISLN